MKIKNSFTKKEEIKVLDKLLSAMHGENYMICKFVMKNLLKISDFSGLIDLKKKYKEFKENIET